MKRPIVRLGTVGIVCALWLGSSSRLGNHFHGCGLEGAEESAGATGATGPWKAGLARAIMTPEKPIWLAGYGHRTHPAEGKIHELWIKVLALEAPDGKRAVFVAGDHLGYPREMYERLSKELASKYRLEPAQVILACSHTHSGPVLGRALLPCYPLDGGRMFRALAWQRLGNLPQAMAWTLRVSQVVSILAVVAALGILFSSFYDENYGLRHPFLDQLQWTLLLLVILQFSMARTAREDRADKEMDSGPFGYDFSYGYTSLDRTTTREAKRSSRLSGIARRFAEKLRARRRGRDEEMRRKVDVLLEKIHSGGMASLSWRERRYLKKASRRMRRS